MIAFSSVSKQYGGQILFIDASFQINPGDKVGLVGPNGAGKSTVFRLIVGEEQPDDGAVEKPRKLTLGYFRQDVGDLRGRSILAETCAGAGEVAALGEELAAGCRFRDCRHGDEPGCAVRGQVDEARLRSFHKLAGERRAGAAKQEAAARLAETRRAKGRKPRLKDDQG